MMGDEVLKHLNGRNPGLSFVRYSGFTAAPHDHLIMMHAIHEVSEGVRKHFSVGVHLLFD